MSAGEVAALEGRLMSVIYGGEVDVFYAFSDRAEKLPVFASLRENY
jgi:hypothetical protein